jgi:sulfur dioxygenase
MIFRQLFDATSSTYTYLLACEKTREAVLIDPVFEQHARDIALIRELSLTLRFTLDTHVHADHVTGAWRMKESAGSRIALAAAAGATGVDVSLVDGDTVSFGAHHLTARATPGHTSGCLSFVLDDGAMAFTGDALLIRGAGRTDFQQGDAHALYHSITRVIFALDDDCLIYPAHDYQGRTVTTVREEKAFNPRCGGEANEDDFTGYMRNLGLPHPRQIDVAVPANLVCGKPATSSPTVASRLPVMRSYAGVPELSLEWLREHIRDVTLLDVREPNEITGELGAIDGIVHIPLGALVARANEIPRDKPVVAICRSGRRSAQACAILERAGFDDVANATGGMLQWRARAF